MVKINREYLDPALLALNQHNNALVEKYKAQQHAVHSASQAVADRQQSKLISSRNLSRGGMIAIVLIGFGIMIALIVWSLPRLVGQLRSPVATIQPILSPPALNLEPSPPALNLEPSTPALNLEPSPPETNNSSADDVTGAPPPALIVPTYSRENGSIGCIQSESFESPCTESVVLENGSTYTGTWSNGSASGEGEITFLDGGIVRGTWQDGALIEILEVSTPAASPAITSSVTVFTRKSVPDLSSKFSVVTAGHNFSRPTDSTWKDAFCYTLVIDRGDAVRMELSDIGNFNEKVHLYNYKTTMRVSKSEFEKAQQMCPYKYTNF